MEVKEEFHKLLGEWCQKELGRSVTDVEQLVLNNPVHMFCNFHAYYLANRKEARLAAAQIVFQYSTTMESIGHRDRNLPGHFLGMFLVC